MASQPDHRILMKDIMFMVGHAETTTVAAVVVDHAVWCCWAVLACKQQLGWKQSSGTFFGEPAFFVYKLSIIVHNLYWLAGVTQLDDALICVFFYSRDQYTNYTSSDSNYMYKVVEYSLT